MTDDRWTKIWDAFTGDPMDPKNNTEAGLRRVVELLDGEADMAWSFLDKLRIQHRNEIQNVWLPLVKEMREFNRS